MTKLTLELFCLATGHRQLDYFNTEIEENKVNYSTFRSGAILYYNLDALTRLMKEWCWTNYEVRLSSGYMYGSEQGKINCCIDAYNGHEYYFNGDYKNFIAATEFEAVLQATHWVAKEKGLI